MLKGRIIRGIAGFYYVAAAGGLYECRARGVFRKNGDKPLVGDFVTLDVLSEEDSTGNIIEIMDRTSELIRPAVANVDQAIVIFASAEPEPNLNLLDRFLCEMERQHIKPVIVFNKNDLIDEKCRKELSDAYAGTGYELVFTNTVEDNDARNRLFELLKGKVSAVAGPSGAGKSSLVNTFTDGITMETGEISRKLRKGRHTTRRAELIPLKDCTDSYIVDTPGFSSLMVPPCEAGELQYLFPEIGKLEEGCYFSGCAHISEPDCAVKAALLRGEISASRYGNYKMFYEDIKGRRKYR